MKLLLFAHVPPPHHGQSYMVQMMLEGFGGDCATRTPGAAKPENKFGIECYHIDARFSSGLEDVGKFRFAKVFELVAYCWKAIRYRLRFGDMAFYYVPAPGVTNPLHRDWLVLALCRPFFRRRIFHWHAVGLGEFLEQQNSVTRRISHSLLDGATLAIALSEFTRADAEKFWPRKVAIVPNGIPDPCPQYATSIRVRRETRARRFQALLGTRKSPTPAAGENGRIVEISVLFLAHCTEEKGLFDAIRGIGLANESLAKESLPLRFHLSVAGRFLNNSDQAEFERMQESPAFKESVRYLGFISGEEKDRQLAEADLLCFPTYYRNEAQPVSLIEAMAYGLPVLTTRWRSIPELLPADYPGLVDVRSPEQISKTLVQVLLSYPAESLRARFLAKFSLSSHLECLASAIRSAAGACAVGLGKPPQASGLDKRIS